MFKNVMIVPEIETNLLFIKKETENIYIANLKMRYANLFIIRHT